MALVVVGALGVGNACAQAQAADAGAQPAVAKSKKKTAKAASAKRTGTVKFMPGSAETAKERSTRLKRECKGRVNAGACEGYTG